MSGGYFNPDERDAEREAARRREDRKGCCFAWLLALLAVYTFLVAFFACILEL